MITVGVDVGSLTAKAVIIDSIQCQVLGNALLHTGRSPEMAGQAVWHAALEAAELDMSDIEASVGTGYGRIAVKGVDWRITEISCHARGAVQVVPGVRTVIDLGGQDAKVICLDEEGRPLDFEMNDRCAAGTGRFLEVMSLALDITVDELARLAVNATSVAALSSTCTVFAESEVVGLLAENYPIDAIAAGLCETIAQRTLQMANRMHVLSPVVLCGGVALNAGVRKAMERALGCEVTVPPEPQLVGALGAAILAGERSGR